MKIILVLAVLSALISCSSTQKVVYDKELSQYQYPFEVKDFKFKSQRQDLVMRYMDIAPTTSPVGVVVLLHGKNFSGYYWKNIIDDLVKKNYRVIVPDQIGFGKSSKPESYQYSFYQLAYNTKALLDSIGITKYTIVGHSMGGMLAVHYSNQYRSNVDKLVLINPIGLEPYLDYVAFQDPEFFYKNEVNKTVEQYRNYQIKSYYDGKWDEKYEALIEPFKGQRNSSDFSVVAWNNALTYGPIFNEDITSQFSKITQPTFFILGTRDRTAPGKPWQKKDSKRVMGQYQNFGKEIKKSIKNVKVFELEGLGHMPQFEDYERFAKIFFNDIF